MSRSRRTASEPSYRATSCACHYALGNIHLRQGDIHRAAACADSLSGLTAKNGNPVGEAFAAIVGCGVAGARGDTEHYRQAREQAITLMEKAVSRGSGSPMI